MPTKILDIRNDVDSKKESRTLLKYCMKSISGKIVKKLGFFRLMVIKV